MKLKEGVALNNLQPQMALACVIVDSVYRRGGHDATITSGSDGDHRGKPVKGDTVDPHYCGKALDFRTSDVSPADLPDLVKSLHFCLGDEFVVLLEKDHVHIQYGRVE